MIVYNAPPVGLSWRPGYQFFDSWGVSVTPGPNLLPQVSCTATSASVRLAIRSVVVIDGLSSTGLYLGFMLLLFDDIGNLTLGIV